MVLPQISIVSKREIIVLNLHEAKVLAQIAVHNGRPALHVVK
jgi:hypothetical protein